MAFKPLFLRGFRPIGSASWSLDEDSLLSVGTNYGPETNTESFKVTFSEFKLYLESLNFVSLTIGSTDLKNRSDGLVSSGNSTIVKYNDTNIKITVDQNIYDAPSAFAFFGTIQNSTIVSDDISRTELVLAAFILGTNWYEATFTVVSGDVNAFAPNSYFHIKDKDVFILGSDDESIKGLMFGLNSRQNISLEGSLSIGSALISLGDNFFSKTLQVGKNESKATSIDFYTTAFNTTYDNATFVGTTEFGTVSTNIDSFKIYSDSVQFFTDNVQFYSNVTLDTAQYLSIGGVTKLKEYSLDLKQSDSGDAAQIDYLFADQIRYDPSGGIKCYIRDEEAFFKWFCIKQEDVPVDGRDQYIDSFGSSWVQGYDGTPPQFELDQYQVSGSPLDLAGLGICYAYRVTSGTIPSPGTSFYFKKTQVQVIQTNCETNLGNIILGENFLSSTNVKGSLFVDYNTVLGGNVVVGGGSLGFDGVATTISDGELTFDDAITINNTATFDNVAQFDGTTTFNGTTNFEIMPSFNAGFNIDGTINTIDLIATNEVKGLSIHSTSILKVDGNSTLGVNGIASDMQIYSNLTIGGTGQQTFFDNVVLFRDAITVEGTTFFNDTNVKLNASNLQLYPHGSDTSLNSQLMMQDSQYSFLTVPTLDYDPPLPPISPANFPSNATTSAGRSYDNMNGFDETGAFFILPYVGIYMVTAGALLKMPGNQSNVNGFRIYIKADETPFNETIITMVDKLEFYVDGMNQINGSVIIKSISANEKYFVRTAHLSSTYAYSILGNSSAYNIGTFLSVHRIA